MNHGERRNHLRRLRVSGRAVDTGALIAPLRADPEHTALLLDIDGTLAPIVKDPARSAIPAPTRTILRSLNVDYKVMGVVTGRRVLDARRLVGLDIDYAGNHGIERSARGTNQVSIDPLVTPWRDTVRDFVRDHCGPTLTAAGVRVEGKDVVITLHWRGAPDEAVARRAVAAAAAQATAMGLRLQAGRGIIEIRPPVAIDKGTAVRHIIDAHPGVRHVLYAGDDRTDVDAMRALHAMQREGRLDTVVRVGVRSREVPAGIVHNSDVLVAGPRGVRRLLNRLVL